MQSLTTLESPRAFAAARSEVSLCEVGTVPKVGTGGAAVTAAMPVGSWIAILLDWPVGEPEASRMLPIDIAVARAVVECMVGYWLFRETDVCGGTIVIGLEVCLKRFKAGEMLGLLDEQAKNDRTWTL